MDFRFSSSSRCSSVSLSAHALSLATAAILFSILFIFFFLLASCTRAFLFFFSDNINARRSLMRFFSFLLFTLPSLGLLGTIGSPGAHWIPAYGPGGLMLALFRRDLRLGRRFGKRVSVKLWKWFEIRKDHGAWPPERKRVSGFGHTELAANEVMEHVEVRDIRVRDRGRTMDLRAPNTISFVWFQVLLMKLWWVFLIIWNQVIHFSKFKQNPSTYNLLEITYESKATRYYVNAMIIQIPINQEPSMILFIYSYIQ